MNKLYRFRIGVRMPLTTEEGDKYKSNTLIAKSVELSTIQEAEAYAQGMLSNIVKWNHLDSNVVFYEIKLCITG
jgi:hypothetical protein